LRKLLYSANTARSTPQKLWQLRHVRRNPPRVVLGEQLGRRQDVVTGVVMAAFLAVFRLRDFGLTL
jgi:hypothetical protein